MRNIAHGQEAQPNSGRRRRHRPNVARVRPKVGQSRTNVNRARPNFPQVGPNCGQLSTKFGQHAVESGPNLTRCSPDWDLIRRPLAEFDQLRDAFGHVWPNMVKQVGEIGRDRRTLIERDRMWANFDQIWADFDPRWPFSTWSEFDQVCPMSTKLGPTFSMSMKFGRDFDKTRPKRD